MPNRWLARSLYAAVLLMLSATLARAQSMPTAERTFTLAGFGMGTGAWTGIGTGAGGRNIGITAGLDLGFHPIFGLRPEAEIRGTYPIDSGQTVAEKSLLGGLKLGYSAPLGFNLYGNFLFGRGEMAYQDGGFPVPSQGLTYTSSSSNIYSLGGGLEHSLTFHFALKADYQFQLWNTPVTPDGKVHPQQFSVGVLYHINPDRYPFPHRRH